MSHLTPDQLSAYLDGATSGAERVAQERHLAECAECRAALAELAALDASLSPLLEHDPGEAYFTSFAGRIEQRLRAEGVHGAQSRGVEDREHRWMDWLRSPRRLAWLGAAAAVIGGVAIVLVTSREDRMSALETSRVSREARVGAGAPAEPRVAPGATPAPAQGAGGAAASNAAGGSAPMRALDETKPSDALKKGVAMQTDDTRGDQAVALPGAPVQEAAPASPAPVTSAERRDAAPSARAVAPQRLYEVKRNENGDVVPVNPSPDLARFAPPPAPANAPKDGEPVRVRKQGFAAPLGAAAKSEAGGAASGSVTGQKERSDAPAPGEIALCGGVIDGEGRAVSGASVTLARLARVAFSGADGRFCMSAPAGDHELLVTAVGFTPRRLQVHVAGDRADVQVALEAVSVLGAGGRLANGGRGANVSGFAARPGGALSLDAAVADPFAALPDSTRLAAREAQRLSAAASVAKNAAAHELAAGRWEHVLAGVPANGAAADAARYRVAEARYGAWHATPNAARAGAATRALDAFLASAPAGASRDLALRWRAALMH